MHHIADDQQLRSLESSISGDEQRPTLSCCCI